MYSHQYNKETPKTISLPNLQQRIRRHTDSKVYAVF